MRHLWITTLAITAVFTSACIPTPVVFVQEPGGDTTETPPPSTPSDPADDTGTAPTDTDTDTDTDPQPAPEPVTITALQITPDTAFNDSQLTCAATVDVASGASPVVVYGWYRVASGEVIGVGPTVQLSGAGVMPGDGVACRAFAQADNYRAEREAFVPIANRPPVIASVTILPDEATHGDTVTCEADASDPDGGDVSLRYVWSTSEAGATITVSGLAPGDTLSCAATATDAFGASTTQITSVDVLPTPPNAPIVGFSTPVPMAEDDLICDIIEEATDPDGSSVSYTYAWSLDGTLVAEAGTSNTLDADFLGVGDQWTCEATATDAFGASGPPASASVRIAPRVVLSELSSFADVAYLALTYVDISAGAPILDLSDLAIVVYNPTNGGVARTTNIPANTLLSAGETYVIACDGDAFDGALPDAVFDLDLSGQPCVIDPSGDAAIALVRADDQQVLDGYGVPEEAGLSSMWGYVDAVVRRGNATVAPSAAFDIDAWDFSASPDDRQPDVWPVQAD